MTAIVKPKPALDEFLKLPETEPASEFLEGEIIQKPMPQGEHSVLQGEICKTINCQCFSRVALQFWRRINRARCSSIPMGKNSFFALW